MNDGSKAAPAAGVAGDTTMKTETVAAAAALLVFAFAGSASAETIGQLPINHGKIKISDYEGNDFTLLDKSTQLAWKFPSGDQQFYEVLTRLKGAGAGNLASLAYVGNGVGEATDHAAWIAPMNADGQPSAYPGKISARDARAFNPQTLSIARIERGVALTDGRTIIAEVRNTEDASSLQLLQRMIETHGLNIVWQIPSAYERTITPVGSTGPVVVFLKADAAPRPQARAKDPIGIAGSVDHLAETPAGVPKLQRQASPSLSPSPIARPQPLVRADVQSPAGRPEPAPRASSAAAPSGPSADQPEESADPAHIPSAEEEAASCNWWSPRCWSLKARVSQTPTAVRQH